MKVCTDAIFKMTDNNDRNPDLLLDINEEEANEPCNAGLEPDEDIEDINMITKLVKNVNKAC
jgi:hypothetical protein